MSTTIVLNGRGEYEIMNNRDMVGRIIPWEPSDPATKYKVQIGQYGGYYNGSYTWNQALDKLITASITSYTNRMLGVKRSANLIYKKRLKANTLHELAP